MGACGVFRCSSFSPFFSSLSPNSSSVPVRTPNRNKPIWCRSELMSQLENKWPFLMFGENWEQKWACRGKGGRRGLWNARRSGSQSRTSWGSLFVSTAQPVLYWCARNMSFWSSISFNLAVLMNLLVAFFYPFKGVRGGTAQIFNFKETSRNSRMAMTCILNGIPGSTGAIDGILVPRFQIRWECNFYHRFIFCLFFVF